MFYHVQVYTIRLFDGAQIGKAGTPVSLTESTLKNGGTVRGQSTATVRECEETDTSYISIEILCFGGKVERTQALAGCRRFLNTFLPTPYVRE